MERWNGRQFFDAFSSGALQVIDNREELNRINVFPVPDGDTGANFAVTLTHIMETTQVSESIGETILSMSDAAIIGARGNSGAIFAQFLSGLGEELKHKAEITREHFAWAVEGAKRRAYAAMGNPQEGTILSVITAWSRSLAEHAKESRTFQELFQRTLPAAEESLARTPEQLEVLRKSGVVDAGAQGFIHFVKGACEFLVTGRRRTASARTLPDIEKAHEPASGDAIRFRYCAEVMLGLPVGLPREEPARGGAEAIRKEVTEVGDSVIVVEAVGKVRVHVHTDDPALLVERLESHGRILQQKADDMRKQFEAVHARKYPIALVTDSASDLPMEILDRYQIHVVPLRISCGGTEYLDRLTLSSERFLGLLESAKPYPTTSQPPAVDFRQLFSFLSRHYDSIIAVNLSSAMSGTWAAAAKEAEKTTGSKITVIDSRHVSASLGLLVLRAAEAIDRGASHEQVVSEVESSIAKTRILVSVRTLEYMVRGGRVGALKGIAAKLMNLKPIVSVDAQGKSLLYGKAFSKRANIGKILRMVEEDHKRHPLREYAVVHAGAPEKARTFADRLRQIIGKEPRYLMSISPVISLNAGPDALCVATTSD